MKRIIYFLLSVLIVSLLLVGCSSGKTISDAELKEKLSQLSVEELNQVINDAGNIEKGMGNAAVAGQAIKKNKYLRVGRTKVKISTRKRVSRIKELARQVQVNKKMFSSKKPYLFKSLVQSKVNPFVFYSIGFKDINSKLLRDKYGNNMYVVGLGKSDLIQSLSSEDRLPIEVPNNKYWAIGIQGQNPNNDQFVMTPPNGGWCLQGNVEGSDPSTSLANSGAITSGIEGGSGLQLWTSCQNQKCEDGSNRNGDTSLSMEGLTMNTGTMNIGGGSPPEGYTSLGTNTPEKGYDGHGAVDGIVGNWGTRDGSYQTFTSDDGLTTMTFVGAEVLVDIQVEDDPKTIGDESGVKKIVRGKRDSTYSVEDEDDYNSFVDLQTAPELGVPEDGSGGDLSGLEVDENPDAVAAEDVLDLETDNSNCETDSTGQCETGSSYCVDYGEGGSCPNQFLGTVLGKLDLFGLFAEQDPSLLYAWVKRDLGFTVDWGSNYEGVSSSGEGPTGWPQLNVDYGRDGTNSWLTQGQSQGDGCNSMGNAVSGAQGEGYNPVSSIEGITGVTGDLPDVNTGKVGGGRSDPTKN